MRKHVITAVLLLLCAAAAAMAQTPCDTARFTVTGRLESPQEYTLRWDPIPGARYYQVEELVGETLAHGDPARIRGFFVEEPSLTVRHESLNDVAYRYRITAWTNFESCSMIRVVRTKGDPVLRRLARRGIVPVVGSTRGANGAVFKTYLKLEGINLKGRVIFHPAGSVASDSDPSIAYDLTTDRKLEWDDIVATLGASGIGSLSIVPDENGPAELPTATVRLYNVAANGVFGTNAEVYPATTFLDETPFQRIEVPADGNFRVNVGARAITAATAKAIAVAADGTEKRSVERAFAAGETVMGTSEAVYGVALEPGEVLLVSFSRGIVPFYTLTDNRTNDPFLYVQGVERDELVDQYSR